MAPANIQSSIADQIGGILQLWIAQNFPDFLLETWEKLFARFCTKSVRKWPMIVLACNFQALVPLTTQQGPK